jgi:uncharacterized surface protein with fasciclin (FAS1) repeats
MKRVIFKMNFGLVFLILVSLLLIQCDKDVVDWGIKTEDLQMIEYIGTDSANYSEFIQIADYVNMTGILSTRGPFTLFLPNNEAWKAYYSAKNKSKFSDFSIDELSMVVRNHVLPAEISTRDIGLGSLSERNAIGDYLVSEFDDSEILINKHSYITNRDIKVANGLIHKIDKVIDPVTKGTYATIKELDHFSIFTNGLELAGLSDTLDIIEIPYGLGTARVRYTILAVPDSVFNANQIYSVNDLLARFDNGKGNITQPGNGFYDYMEYHCIEGTYYMSDIEDEVYYTISRTNFLNMSVTTDFLINSTEEDSIITTFIQLYSNIPTKNGVIHGITQLLPATESVPQTHTIDLTALPEFMELEIYNADGTKNFYDGENGIAKIKWTGDYLQYWRKFQGTGFINEDCIVMSEGYWTLEITLPKIASGKYSVYGYFKKGYNRANVIFYFDDVKVDKVIDLNTIIDGVYFVDEYICDVDWPTTQEHVVKLKTVYPGTIMWDRLTFIPIE